MDTQHKWRRIGTLRTSTTTQQDKNINTPVRSTTRLRSRLRTTVPTNPSTWRDLRQTTHVSSPLHSIKTSIQPSVNTKNSTISKQSNHQINSTDSSSVFTNVKLTDLCPEERKKVSELVHRIIELGQKHENTIQEYNKERENYINEIQKLRQDMKQTIIKKDEIQKQRHVALIKAKEYQDRVRILEQSNHIAIQDRQEIEKTMDLLKFEVEKLRHLVGQQKNENRIIQESREHELLQQITQLKQQLENKEKELLIERQERIQEQKQALDERLHLQSLLQEQTVAQMKQSQIQLNECKCSRVQVKNESIDIDKEQDIVHTPTPRAVRQRRQRRTVPNIQRLKFERDLTKSLKTPPANGFRNSNLSESSDELNTHETQHERRQTRTNRPLNSNFPALYLSSSSSSIDSTSLSLGSKHERDKTKTNGKPTSFLRMTSSSKRLNPATRSRSNRSPSDSANSAQKLSEPLKKRNRIRSLMDDEHFNLVQTMNAPITTDEELETKSVYFRNVKKKSAMNQLQTSKDSYKDIPQHLSLYESSMFDAIAMVDTDVNMQRSTKQLNRDIHTIMQETKAREVKLHHGRPDTNVSMNDSLRVLETLNGNKHL